MKDRLPKPVRVTLLSISSAACVVSGCIHVTHPSNVRPGWSAEVAGGVSDERYSADAGCGECERAGQASGNAGVFQMNLAWGKKLGNGDALRAGLMVPLSMNNGSALGAMAGTTLDFYYQFLEGPFNLGAGGLAGAAIDGVYLEAGKTLYSSGGFEMNIDTGVSAEMALFREAGIRPFVIAGFAGKRLHAGIWADYMKYRDYFKRCDENCESDDFLEESFSGGVFIGGRL